MKYIRTKDGIWLFGGTHDKGNVVIGKKHEYDFGYCFSKADILKQADTIEELCDEFVVYKNTYNYDIWHSLISDDKKAVMIALKDGFEIYGAIWTDKGLIYVAKINEKGELELL